MDIEVDTKVAAVMKYSELVASGMKKGKAAEQVARSVGVHQDTIPRLARNFANHGLEGLRNKQEGNKNRSKLTEKVAAALHKTMGKDNTTTSRELSPELGVSPSTANR